MYRGYLNRKKETQARATQQQSNTPAVPVSQSPFSLAPSFPSYAPASRLPAAPSFNSSRPDITSSDHSLSSRALSSSPKNRFFPVAISPAPRSTTPASMGQATSTAESPPQSPATQAYAIGASLPSPSSNPLKRIWGGRRKKSEDVTAVFANAQDLSFSTGKEHAQNVSATSSVLSTPASSVDDLQVQTEVPLARRPSRTKRLLQLQKPPKKSPQTLAAQDSSGFPPALPPKPTQTQVWKRPSQTETGEELTPPATARSPGMSAAIQLLQSQAISSSLNLKDRTDAELKQDWRKSDSTVMSYVTIRPGALTSGRSTRPVSLAESSHSGHTIVPVNKRLSALLTDAEFAMLEESDSDTEQDIPITISGRLSPTSSLKARKRRSASLNLGPGYSSKTLAASSTSVSTSAMPRLSRTFTDTNHVFRGIPSPKHITSSSAASSSTQRTMTSPANPTNGSTRSQFATWTTPLSERALPTQQHQRLPTSPTHTRQLKVSMSGGGFAPAAFGLGKRAAEKVHRVWEGLSSGSSHQSTHSSSSASLDTPSRPASRQSIYGLQSSLPGAWKQQRRTPGAPSGAWSISSSIVSTESDSFAAPGPVLGPCVRGPKCNAVGTHVIGGVLFGKELRACVQETAIKGVLEMLGQNGATMEVGSIKPLEQRMLPAIVVRCYQHLMRWGMEEEGLFRINGRASHVAKLRSAFDTGADYELVRSDPGDLDPHAVASIFKAFLRELPESLLTSSLVSLFESSLLSDNGALQLQSSAARGGLSLRKPPSLSTLAMPSFAGQRMVSGQAVQTLSSLIAQLPIENRDLLFTVVELINATAAASKETKMPLGNLLLLFCPSMGISHTLLRVLCEAKDIWTLQQDKAPIGTTPKLIDISSDSTSFVVSDDSCSSLSNTDSESDVPAARPRPGKRRGPVATLLDVPGISLYSNSSGSGQDDAASYMSALDGSPSVSNESSTHLPALSTSTDSLATPSTMSEVSSLQQPTTICPTVEATKDSAGCSPDEPSIVDLSLPVSPKRPLISAPIPFPSSSESSPRTPLSTRRSMTLLSFPPSGKSDSGGQEGAGSWTHRPKRPSLHLLFSKKSTSSFKSPSSASTQKDSSTTTADAVTIHTPAPPVLDTAISSSPIYLFDPVGKLTVQESAQPDSSLDNMLSVKENDWQGRERKDSSSGSSLFSTPQQTPIADYFRGRSKSLVSILLDTDDGTTSRGSPKVSPTAVSALASASRNSPTPSIDLGIESTVEEDWAQSVIEEAQATSSIPAKSRWRVSRLF